jgi:coenzyme F420 hydrogenase subunit beta
MRLPQDETHPDQMPAKFVGLSRLGGLQLQGMADGKTLADIDPAILSAGIFNEDLCARCGTCTGSCPTKAISINDRHFPVIDPEACIECGICNTVCPGDKVPYHALAETTFGWDPHEAVETFDGYTLKTFVGHATDETIRSKGAGGGIITGLLWDLLKSGEVDGCVVTRMKPEEPWIGEPFIARTYEDLLSSQGSKYTLIPVNQIIQDIREMPGRFAFAGLPCQIHGLRLLMEAEPALKEKIVAVIGLFCGGAMELNLIPELLQAKGISKSELKDFEFRGGEWPGRFRAIKQDGTPVDIHRYDYSVGAYNWLIHIYTPKRCQTCMDGSAQFADIAISDAWTRGADGQHKFKNRSRTQRGLDLVKQAEQRGSLVCEDVSGDPDYETYKTQTRRKRRGAPIRIQRWGGRGIAVPEYDIQLPEANDKEKLNERVSAFFLWLGQYKWFRMVVLKVITTRLSVPLVEYRIWAKKRRHIKRQADQ